MDPYFIGPVCDSSQFRCVSDGSCIDKWRECDGVFDCPDNSDEDVLKCLRRKCLLTSLWKILYFIDVGLA